MWIAPHRIDIKSSCPSIWSDSPILRVAVNTARSLSQHTNRQCDIEAQKCRRWNLLPQAVCRQQTNQPPLSWSFFSSFARWRLGWRYCVFLCKHQMSIKAVLKHKLTWCCGYDLFKIPGKNWSSKAEAERRPTKIWVQHSRDPNQ